MSVIEHIKDLISPMGAEDATEWAARWFPEPQRAIAAGVVQCVAAISSSDAERATPQSRLLQDLGLNELQQVQLILAVEEQFNLEISNDEGQGLQTIGQLVECLHAKPKEQRRL